MLLPDQSLAFGNFKIWKLGITKTIFNKIKQLTRESIVLNIEKS